MKLPYYRAIFLHLSVVFTFLFGFTINAQIIQIGQDIDGEAAYNHFGRSVSMNVAGDRLAIGAPENNGNGTNDFGDEIIYTITATNIGNVPLTSLNLNDVLTRKGNMEKIHGIFGSRPRL